MLKKSYYFNIHIIFLVIFSGFLSISIYSIISILSGYPSIIYLDNAIFLLASTFWLTINQIRHVVGEKSRSSSGILFGDIWGILLPALIRIITDGAEESLSQLSIILFILISLLLVRQVLEKLFVVKNIIGNKLQQVATKTRPSVSYIENIQVIPPNTQAISNLQEVDCDEFLVILDRVILWNKEKNN